MTEGNHSSKSKEKRRGHNEGTGYQRADGRWEWKITLEDGTRKSFYAPTQRQAREKASAWVRELEDGLDPKVANITVGDFLDQWIKDTVAHRVRPSTLASYSGHIEHHIKPAFGSTKLRNLTVQQVNAMMADMTRAGAAPSTANLVRATLRGALASAVKWGYVRQNVAVLADPRPVRRQKVQPLEPAEMMRFLRLTANESHGMLYLVAVHTGLRQGELLALTWDDVDLDAGVLRVTHTVTKVDGRLARTAPKTQQSERELALSRQAIEAVKAQRKRVQQLELLATDRWQENNLVFPSTTGTFLHASNVTNQFQLQLARYGFPKQRFHDLRHQTASILLAEGMDLFAVKEILGHSQIALTANLYGHLTKKLSRVAADRMSSALGDDDK